MATILVVDDEREIRASVRGILEEEGFTVLEAEDGRQAIDVLRDTTPELVLLDIWMPNIDGLELLSRLQGRMHPPEVIVVSGHGNIETAVRATKLGAFDFIEKPFSLDSLVEVVNRALRHHEAKSGDAATEHAGNGGAPTAGAGSSGCAGSRHPDRVAQKTIARSVVASGTGLHTGVKTGLVLQPLPPDSGIHFTSLSADVSVPAHIDWVDSTGYATALHRQGVTVQTVEHLLATLHAYGITNLLVKFQGEIPIMDGSAIEFCRLIESVGVEEQRRDIDVIVVAERLAVERPNGEAISIEPSDGFSISYTLHYPHPVGVQQYTFELTGPESFRDLVAPARTFGFMRDMKQLASMGLATGGRLDNCILIDDEKVVNTTLRFPDEFARHKVLDVMGDIYLLGRPLRGRIVAERTGHSDNIELVRKIKAACEGGAAEAVALSS
jgi:UDP-3-O-acyl N-acetylglucosamine deacetylase